MSRTPNETVPPETGHQESAIPIARRLARKTEFFPLAWHGARTEERMPMVGWYDPLQFCSTGLKSLVSLFVGERSDRRIVQALAARRQQYDDHTIHYRDGGRGPQPMKDRARDELWIDFVCDTGDGWNSTYAIAYAAAQRSLQVVGPEVPSICLAPIC